MTSLDELLSRLGEAEARALVDHRVGRCHQSDRSCAYCAAEDAVRGQQPPCPAWCDGRHPHPGGNGNRAHVRIRNGIGLEWVTNDNGRRDSVNVRWFGRGSVFSQYFGVEGLRQVAADALALAEEIEALVPSDVESTVSA